MVGWLIERWVNARHKPTSIDDVRREIESTYDAYGHEIAKDLTRGNVSIQQGAFLMREDLEQRAKDAA